MDMPWWIWLVFGIALILLERVLPTFFILWFGIGAVLVSLISLAAPSLQLDMQVLLWVLLSSEKADVTRAEGAKQAAILEAEARLQAARLDAEAQISLAGGNNAKVVVLPADLQETVRGLMGRGKA